MQKPALECGQDRNGIRMRFYAAFFADKKIGEQGIAGGVQPIIQLARHLEARFVRMEDVTGQKLFLDLIFSGFELLECRFVVGNRRAFVQIMPKQVFEQHTGFLKRQLARVV